MVLVKPKSSRSLLIQFALSGIGSDLSLQCSFVLTECLSLGCFSNQPYLEETSVVFVLAGSWRNKNVP